MNADITYMDNLILSGALEVAGIGEDGKFTYQFTDKLNEVDPELKNKIEQSFYEAIMHLWAEGFLVVSSGEGMDDAKVTASSKALDSTAVRGLSSYYQKILSLILEALQQ